MNLSKIALLVFLAPILCTNLYAITDTITTSTPFPTLHEKSILKVAQNMFDGTKGAPTIENLENDSIIPETLVPFVKEKLYGLCFETSTTDLRKQKPEWLRLWFARENYKKTGSDIGEQVGINDIGGFPITELMEQSWFPKPANGKWNVSNKKINDFTGFEHIDNNVLKTLQELYLGVNKLTTLPPELWQLTKLKKLSIDNNQVAELSASIGNLKNLQELDLYGNKLTALPSEIGQLTQLMLLNLYENHLVSLIPTLGNLTQLNWLSLGNNPALGDKARYYSGKELQTLLRSLREEQQAGRSNTLSTKK